MTGRVPVLVCGEPLRGDDAAGLAAVALLAADIRALADVREVGMLDVLTLLDIPAGRAAVVVDAVSGLPSGRVVARSLTSLVEFDGAGIRPRSSHELPLPDALALAAVVRGALSAGTFVGLAGEAWDLGAPLSATVEAALPSFAAAIAAAIREAASGQQGSTRGRHGAGRARTARRRVADAAPDGRGPHDDESPNGRRTCATGDEAATRRLHAAETPDQR